MVVVAAKDEWNTKNHSFMKCNLLKGNEDACQDKIRSCVVPRTYLLTKIWQLNSSVGGANRSNRRHNSACFWARLYDIYNRNYMCLQNVFKCLKTPWANHDENIIRMKKEFACIILPPLYMSHVIEAFYWRMGRITAFLVNC